MLGYPDAELIIISVISLEWILWGYSMAFGPDKFGLIGGLEWFGLRGVGMTPTLPTVQRCPIRCS